MMSTGDTTGSPGRKVWASIEASGRGGKRGPEKMAMPGGATAPLPVGAIGTPPAQRRRIRDFVTTVPDTAGQLQELLVYVQEEFGKVLGGRAEGRG